MIKFIIVVGIKPPHEHMVIAMLFVVMFPPRVGLLPIIIRAAHHVVNVFC